MGKCRQSIVRIRCPIYAKLYVSRLFDPPTYTSQLWGLFWQQQKSFASFFPLVPGTRWAVTFLPFRILRNHGAGVVVLYTLTTGANALRHPAAILHTARAKLDLILYLRSVFAHEIPIFMPTTLIADCLSVAIGKLQVTSIFPQKVVYSPTCFAEHTLVKILLTFDSRTVFVSS